MKVESSSALHVRTGLSCREMNVEVGERKESSEGVSYLEMEKGEMLWREDEEK